MSVITGVLGAGLSFVLTRRVYTAKADNDEASTIQILNGVVKDLMRQVKAFIHETSTWQAKLTDVEAERDRHAKMATAAQELADRRLKEIERLKDEASIVAEEMSHLSYIADGDEKDSIVAKRFRAVKEAAERIIQEEICH